MKNIFAEIFDRDITRDQSKDTGMAMVLLLLLLSAGLKRHGFMTAAIIALLIDMTVPRFYRPIAVVWLGLSHLLGIVVSKVLLTLVFCVIVVPIGMVRRVLGYDSLQLKKFKSGEDSVMTVRDHTFTGKDIEKPY
jgi:hypothetical protein